MKKKANRTKLLMKKAIVLYVCVCAAMWSNALELLVFQAKIVVVAVAAVYDGVLSCVHMEI